MLRTTPASVLATLAVLAGTGCIPDHVDMTEAVKPAAAALAMPPLGHELHRIFLDEKRDALFAELPAQF